MLKQSVIIVCFTAFSAALSMSASADSPADSEAFEKEVRPLLVEHCLKCHGVEKQKAGLRLDSRKAMLDGGESGAAIVAGRPDESLLITAIKQKTDLKMPPGKALAPEQVAALERWIAAGAPWPENQSLSADSRQAAWSSHWAFRPIGDPAPPALVDSTWCRNPVDAFVKATLDARGLLPSPPADRHQLIRRVTYDLTGLPPTLAEVQAFVEDTSPNAYEKLVDRLLASPRYGEQWARHWLDVARYADTKGYVYDREERFLVQAPAFRDWVVKAFNDDMPYDRFLVEQIAADQAEPENKSALAAMGFLTVGRRFLGVTHDIIDDRIDVVCRGTMGLTVACARCHDHKFDPIPTADYYSLYGVFQNCTERQIRLAEPSVNDESSHAFEKELSARTEKLQAKMRESRAEASRRVRSRIADYLLVQRDFSKIPREGFDVILSADDLSPASARRWRLYLANAEKSDDPIFRPWRRFAGLSDAEFATRAEETADSLKQGHALNRRVAEAFAKPPATIAEVAERYKRVFAEVDRLWREAVRLSEANKKTHPEKLDDPDAEALRQVLYADRGPCVVPDEPIVSNEFYFDTKTVEEIWRLQGEVDRWLIQSPKAPPYAVAVVDRAELREPRIFKRGNSSNQGDVVPRRFLEVAAGPGRKPFEHGSGRLDLAKAIVDPSNPLTARVWVNRVWMHHFGAGLVRTPSDFGVRAEAPSHPELLDWLARRLIEGGWSTKAIHRLIVNSAAYRQQSASPADPSTRELVSKIDAENRLLWRMNPHRLTIEEAHDSALAVTGELDLREGGRASELFPKGATNPRRALYGLVDRQFLSNVLRIFDFANPDMHAPARSETTVPQQALFAMNHPFIADRAQALAVKIKAESPETAVRRLYQAVYQRDPTEAQSRAALEYLGSASTDEIPAVAPEVLAWRYGIGKVKPEGPALSFEPLPHFDGTAWSGGPKWPDPKLGWVQLSAKGGHPGNDLDHAAIRRWTAAKTGQVAIKGIVRHEVAEGDGIRARLVSSRHGVLKKADVHNGKWDFSVDSIGVEPGDTLDFIVDIREVLNSDQYLWEVDIQELDRPDGGMTWNSSRDFAGPPARRLSALEQLAQVLLMANEFMFVD